MKNLIEGIVKIVLDWKSFKESGFIPPPLPMELNKKTSLIIKDIPKEDLNDPALQILKQYGFVIEFEDQTPQL